MPEVSAIGTDWRVIDGVATAWFDAPSLAEGAALAGRIVESSAEIAVDLRATGVRVRLDTDEHAEAVSAAARDHGLAADPAVPDQPPVRIERLKLASTTGSQIEKGLDGLFHVAGGVLPNDENARVTTGALEQSNVVPSEVLVEMVEAQRLFDIRTKLVSTARELDEGSARLMRIS